MKILTIGGATQDIIFRTRKALVVDNKEDPLAQKLMAFEYGAKIKMEEASLSFGGGANNVAICLAKLGFKIKAQLVVGNDEIGKALLKNLRTHKVGISRQAQIAGATTGFSVIVVGGQKDDHIALLYRGANEEMILEPENFKGFDWFYLSSLNGPNREKNLRAVYHAARDYQTKLMYNPGSEDLAGNVSLVRRVASQAEILSLNRDEALELAMKLEPRQSFNDYQAIFKAVYSLGSRLVVITDGKHGARAYDGKDFYFTRAYKVKKVVDTTGAGDAFGAGFLAGFIYHKNEIIKALKTGVKSGGLVVRKFGAQAGLANKKQLFK